MADALFKKYKKKIIKEVGRKALADDEITKLCKELFGSKFKKVVCQDRLQLLQATIFVVPINQLILILIHPIG